MGHQLLNIEHDSIWYEERVSAPEPVREWRYQGLFLPNAAGDYKIKAVIDKGKKIFESNENNPVSLIKGAGISATLIGMDYFEVSDPPKNVVLADLKHHPADVKITICDKLCNLLFWQEYLIWLGDVKLDCDYNGLRCLTT